MSGPGRSFGSDLGGLGHPRQLYAAQRKMTDKFTAAAECALDLQLGPVALQHVFDNCKT